MAGIEDALKSVLSGLLKKDGDVTPPKDPKIEDKKDPVVDPSKKNDPKDPKIEDKKDPEDPNKSIAEVDFISKLKAGLAEKLNADKLYNPKYIEEQLANLNEDTLTSMIISGVTSIDTVKNEQDYGSIDNSLFKKNGSNDLVFDGTLN